MLIVIYIIYSNVLIEFFNKLILKEFFICFFIKVIIVNIKYFGLSRFICIILFWVLCKISIIYYFCFFGMLECSINEYIFDRVE